MANNIKPDKVKERNTPKPRGPMQALDLSYNDKAGAFNVTSRVIPPIRKFFGDLTTAKAVEGSTYAQVRRKPGGYVLVVNTTPTFVFVATSTSNTLTVTDATNGIPIPPNDWVIVSLGENTWIKSSAAGVFGYEIDADTWIS